MKVPEKWQDGEIGANSQKIDNFDKFKIDHHCGRNNTGQLTASTV